MTAANALRNAGFLDWTDGWSAAGGLTTLQVAEEVWGAPGRAVLEALGTTGSVGAEAVIRSASVAIGSVATVEIGGLHTNGSGGSAAHVLRVQFLDGSDAAVGAPVAVPRQRAGKQPPRRGLEATFEKSWGLVSRPSGASRARLELLATTTASGIANRLLLFWPFLAPDAAAVAGVASRWDPGVHGSEDLNLPRWPASLPPFPAGGGVEPLPVRTAFASDVGPPRMRKLHAGRPFATYRGRLRLDDERQDALEQFHADGEGEFFFVRPDDGTLCLAEFTEDGAPRVVGEAGPWRWVEVGLTLGVA